MIHRDHRPLLASVLAIGVMFFVNGFAFGSWVPRLPEIREALDITDAALGLTLLGAGIGGVIMSGLSSRILARVGSRSAVVATSVALSLLIPGVALAPSAVVLFVVLVVLGAIDGLTDVAQNSQALEVQGRIRRSIITRMHGAWSIGTLLGGLTSSWAARADLSFRVHLTVVALALAAATIVARHWLLPSARRAQGEPGPARTSAATRGRLAVLFGVGVLAILAEMPPTEWASLIMAERFDLPTGDASLGFVAFAVGMVLGRVGGDVVVDRAGAEAARRGGSALSLIGVVLVAASPAEPVAWIGFALAGVGASSLFPLAIRRASDITEGAAGVAAFSSGTRAAMLAGSPVMGFLSEATTRTIALLAVAGTAALASAVLRLPDA